MPPERGAHRISRQVYSAVRRLTEHIGVVVTAPRRYGKSSLVLWACTELKKQAPEPAIVSVNLLQVGSPTSACGLLLHRLYQVPGGPWHLLRRVLPGSFGGSVWHHRRPSTRTGFLDELQAVTVLDPHLPQRLKGPCDQCRRVPLVLAGSKQHRMESLVLSRGDCRPPRRRPGCRRSVLRRMVLSGRGHALSEWHSTGSRWPVRLPGR